jgi:uncharacterized SAM-binding protein YcdF (DUF218 family)
MANLGARWLVVSEPLASADALVVMAGAPVYTDRIQHAAALFRSGRALRVLLTDDGLKRAWSRELQRNPSSMEQGLAALERGGVPRDRVEVLPGIVHGTIDEARAVKRYVSATGVRSLVVVTSPYHSRRALWALKHELRGEGVIVGSDPTPMTPTSPRPADWWIRRSGWRTVGEEFVKLPYYWVVHGLGSYSG